MTFDFCKKKKSDSNYWKWTDEEKTQAVYERLKYFEKKISNKSEDYKALTEEEKIEICREGIHRNSGFAWCRHCWWPCGDSACNPYKCFRIWMQEYERMAE